MGKRVPTHSIRVFIYLFALLSGMLYASSDYQTSAQIDTKKARAVAYDKGYVYVADDKGGLKIIDTQNDSMHLIGSFVHKKVRYFDVAIKDQYAYLTAYDKGVDIIDISDPKNPQLVATLQTDDLATSLEIQDHTLYIADRRGGVIIADITDPSDPKRIATVKSYQAQDVLIDGSMLYIANGKGGIKIVDVQEKTDPKLLSDLKLADKTRALAMENGMLYVATRYAGVTVIDVSTPTSPKIVQTIDTEGKAIHIASQNGKIYLSDGANGLLILDAASYETIEHIATPSKLRGVSMNGTTLFLAANNAGVIRLDPKKAPLPEATSMHPLSQSTWNTLNDEARLSIAHKLFATLYYGMDPIAFRTLALSDNFIEDAYTLFTQEADESKLSEVESQLAYFSDGYRGSDAGKEISTVLARLYLLPPSKTYVDYWSTYVLTQTILFSPALELNTVEDEDALIVYNDLFNDIHQGLSIADSTYNHVITQSNWRRFRSPEDNGREMLEIYLMDFDDSHVPLAAKALQNWHLDRKHNLIIDDNENTEPITDLFPGQTVINGYDYYDALVADSRFLPTVTRRLVQIYFTNFSEEDQEKIVNGLLARKPHTWSDLLLDIVFSEKYLLETERLKGYEEIFFPMVKSMSAWIPKSKTFYTLQDDMAQMHQASMRYKLGRSAKVPDDTESIGWMHNKLRSRVLLNPLGNKDAASLDDGIDSWGRLPDELYTEGEFDENGKRTELWATQERKRSDFIVEKFITPFAGRFATQEEKVMLGDYIDNALKDKETFDNRAWVDLYNYNNPDRDEWGNREFTYWVLDYISRLSSTYEFYAVKGGDQ